MQKMYFVLSFIAASELRVVWIFVQPTSNEKYPQSSTLLFKSTDRCKDYINSKGWVARVIQFFRDNEQWGAFKTRIMFCQ